MDNGRAPEHAQQQADGNPFARNSTELRDLRKIDPIHETAIACRDLKRLMARRCDTAELLEFRCGAGLISARTDFETVPV